MISYLYMYIHTVITRMKFCFAPCLEEIARLRFSHQPWISWAIRWCKLCHTAAEAPSTKAPNRIYLYISLYISHIAKNMTSYLSTRGESFCKKYIFSQESLCTQIHKCMEQSYHKHHIVELGDVLYTNIRYILSFSPFYIDVFLVSLE